MQLRREGQTVMLVAVDGAAAGLVAVADPVKDNAAAALAALRAEGLRLVMLTGDSRTTAEAVGRRLGIDEVVAEVLPDEKARVVRDLQQQRHVVAMAGDGVNDAPALAQADIGIAMGTGADIAMESAALTLVKGDLRRHRARPPAVARDHAQHPAEFVLRLRLQRAGDPDRGRRALPGLRPPAQPDDRQRRDERQLGAGHQQRAQVAPGAAMTSVWWPDLINQRRKSAQGGAPHPPPTARSRRFRPFVEPPRSTHCSPPSNRSRGRISMVSVL